jgi:glycosyltransferase involved in cell wall biosynthesis
MDVIYFKTVNSSFVLKDQYILERNFKTHSYLIDMGSAFKYAIALIKLFFFLVYRGRKYKVYFVRFADWHTAMISIFKILYDRKLVVVVGGYDVAKIHELNYGAHVRFFRGKMVNFTFKKADLLLPNHYKLINYENSFGLKKSCKGGINTFVDIENQKIKVVFNGFDSNKFHAGNVEKDQNLALTIAAISNERTFRLKGINYFIEVARSLPQRQFMVIGLKKSVLEKLQIVIPENLIVKEFVPHEKLLEYYQRAKVFCIFSLSEGMPNVLCEAMLSECIPVGSNVSSIPDIIDKYGYIVNNSGINHISEKVEKAFSEGLDLGKNARKHIQQNYPETKREYMLVNIINSFLN